MTATPMNATTALAPRRSERSAPHLEILTMPEQHPSLSIGFHVGDLVDIRNNDGQTFRATGVRITERVTMKSGTRLTLDDGSKWDAVKREPWRSGLNAPPNIWRHGSSTW